MTQTNSKCQRKKEKKLKGCWKFCSFLKASWETFEDYCGETSMHGVKYLTDKNLPWSEKLFWFVALLLSISTCSYLVYDSYSNWQNSPVIVSFSENFMNIWEIPFAAITICPIGGLYPIDRNNKFKNFTGSTDQRIKNVFWRGLKVNSTEFFTEIKTAEGFCWSFNLLNYHDMFDDTLVTFEAFDNLKTHQVNHPNNWNLEFGYNSKEHEDYPHRPAGWGENGGLKFEIWRGFDEIYKIKEANKGFKVAFHLPCEVPSLDKHYFLVPLQKFATIIITPSLITDTNNLKSYTIKKRQCYYEDDKKLAFFKMYTINNCQLECAANFTNQVCGCSHFSLPRNKTQKLCNLTESTTCYKRAINDLMMKNMMKSLATSKGYDDQGKLSCDCLPSCTSIKYEGEITYDDIRVYANSRSKNDNRTVNSTYSSLSIFFKDDSFIFTKRSELLNFTSFIASFGGIIGLFLGVSILSTVEILYFSLFRKQKKDEKTGNGSENTANGSAISIVGD